MWFGFFITKVPVFGELKTENLRKQGVQRFQFSEFSVFDIAPIILTLSARQVVVDT